MLASSREGFGVERQGLCAGLGFKDWNMDQRRNHRNNNQRTTTGTVQASSPQPNRSSTAAPPVRWPGSAQAPVQRQTAGHSPSRGPSVPVPPVKWAERSSPVQPRVATGTPRPAPPPPPVRPVVQAKAAHVKAALAGVSRPAQGNVHPRSSGIAQPRQAPHALMKPKHDPRPQGHGKVVQRYGPDPYGSGGNYVPVLAEPVSGHHAHPYSKATFGRPAWDPATIAFMWDGDGSEKQQATIAMANGRSIPVLLYQCGACGGWGVAGEMQIGHRENWQDYVAATVPADTAEATWAYQDLRNLRMEHLDCNQGHAFENYDSGEYDKKDPFIDDSNEDPEETSRAFKQLRSFLAGGTPTGTTSK